jgi:hypothetical protein
MKLRRWFDVSLASLPFTQGEILNEEQKQWDAVLSRRITVSVEKVIVVM